MYALCSGSAMIPGSIRLATLSDGRTFLTDSITLAAVAAEEATLSDGVRWTVCCLPNHLPLTVPFAPVRVAPLR